MPFRVRGHEIVMDKAPQAGSFDFDVTAYEGDVSEPLSLRGVVTCAGLTAGGTTATVALALTLSGFSAAQFAVGSGDDNIAGVEVALSRAVGIAEAATSVTAAADVVDAAGGSAALLSVAMGVPASLLSGGVDLAISMSLDVASVASG
eukprot:CAMPEP_0203829636 /NCGR_PEP_ID=MMETSP0115-20131106/63974_1 /ASSEMBLY_ACC=CAM_ASM_000227 /TAXON_ID=33651 /ORGANISM="Bicosoecid sp, Strain ms1" /LENGTH=147 /DNA_ID=CAMNT_0050738699 /DNA_START=1 /DNA_END=440 /DNA_ORIENTATION=+